MTDNNIQGKVLFLFPKPHLLFLSAVTLVKADPNLFAAYQFFAGQKINMPSEKVMNQTISPYDGICVFDSFKNTNAAKRFEKRIEGCGEKGGKLSSKVFFLSPRSQNAFSRLLLGAERCGKG